MGTPGMSELSKYLETKNNKMKKEKEKSGWCMVCVGGMGVGRLSVCGGWSRKRIVNKASK
jgi:hypothetical protein